MARRIAPHGLRDRAGAAARRRAADPARPPRGDERVDQAVRRGPAGRDRAGRGRRRGARRGHHRRRPRVLLRRRPQGGLRPHAGGASGRAHGPHGPLSPDHHGDPAHAQARRGGGQRPRRRHRAVAGARRGPGHRARERLLPAGVREHRAGARRGVVAVRARAGRLHPRRGDGHARREDHGAPGPRVGADQPRGGRRRLRIGGRRAGPAARGRAHPLLRGHEAPAQRVAVRPDGRPARARGRRPAGVGRDGRLHGRRAGLHREAPARLRGPLSAMARPHHVSAAGLHILRRRMLKVLFTRAMTAALAGLALAPAAASAGVFFPERGGSENADKIWTLYLLIFILAWIVFLGVAGALLWAMIKFRARPRRNMVAAQIHGNTRLEIGWTVGAFVILVFITVFTFITLPGIKNPAASDIDENGNPVTASNVLYAATDQPP